MFEKEAEEYVNNNFYNLIEEVQEVAKVTFKDGAEFGYNKANEWHYPKEKLPTKDCEVLIEYGKHKTHRVVDWDSKSQHFGGFSIDEVTRWKEVK